VKEISYNTYYSFIVFTTLPNTEGGLGTSVSIATEYGLDSPGIENKNSGWGEIFRTRPERPWGPPSLLYNGTGSFPVVKRPGRGADHISLPTAEVENE
jgi:hypothetical protein